MKLPVEIPRYLRGGRDVGCCDPWNALFPFVISSLIELDLQLSGIPYNPVIKLGYWSVKEIHLFSHNTKAKVTIRTTEKKLIMLIISKTGSITPEMQKQILVSNCYHAFRGL